MWWPVASLPRRGFSVAENGLKGMSMDSITALLEKYGRPFLVKYVARGVLYGATAISAKLSIDAPNQDAQQQVVNWTVTVLLAGLTMLVDYYRHKSDQVVAAPLLAAKVDDLKGQLADAKATIADAK